MINEKCDGCGKTVSLSDIYIIENSKLCNTCAEEFHKTHKEIPVAEFKRQQDRTVCVNCHKDNGTQEFSLMAGQPVCEECSKFFKNRPYPGWIKAAMFGLAAIVIFSFAWNWRFIGAYMDLRDMKTALHTRDFETAAKSLHSASSKVPETRWLSALATFYDGLLLLKDDKPEEAKKMFNASKAELPAGYPVEEMIISAEAGIAFDKKDYDKFLTLAIQRQETNPKSPTAVAQVASAYACKYAVTGDEQFKQQSLEFLKKAKTLAEQKRDLKTFEEYEDRILHRLETREIINIKEFNEKFPHGWKNQQKEQNK